MSSELDIITIGESLIELSSVQSLFRTTTFDKYYGGDALTVAVSAKRLGSEVGYITRVGNDGFKDYLLDAWDSEGLDISQVKITQCTNGLYIVTFSDNGEPEYSYFIKKTAGSSFDISDIDIEYLKKTKIFYASGILQTLSINAKATIKNAYTLAKKNDILTAYKPNFLSNLFNQEEFRENFYDICSDLDILFLSFQKEGEMLFEIESTNNLIKYLWSLGISVVVIKSFSESGYYTGANGSINFTKFYTDKIIDTTCSTDAFAGAFLHAIAKGMNAKEATKLAVIVEGLQTQKIGAIKSLPQKDEVYKIYRSLYE